MTSIRPDACSLNSGGDDGSQKHLQLRQSAFWICPGTSRRIGHLQCRGFLAADAASWQGGSESWHPRTNTWRSTDADHLPRWRTCSRNRPHPSWCTTKAVVGLVACRKASGKSLPIIWAAPANPHGSSGSVASTCKASSVGRNSRSNSDSRFKSRKGTCRISSIHRFTKFAFSM